MSNCAETILALYKACEDFGHMFRGKSKQVIILTDSKSVTRFFQIRMVPPPIWNACDSALQIIFTPAHIISETNLAADLISRLETDANEKKTSLELYKSFLPNKLKSTLD